jgi:PAS domain S-box-containing protein
MKGAPEIFDHPGRILVVDDERLNRELIRVMLAPDGFEVIMAASGEEAMTTLAANAPDLIILDVMMPGIDGYAVARAVKENPATQNIPVIMVTALGDREARMRGLDAGAEDFLNKPVDRAELRARVRNLLRLKAYGDYYGKYSETLERQVRARTLDLAERSKRLEEQTTALLRSEERTNYALGGARMGVWELDVGTWRITWSDTMASVFGLESRDAPSGITAFLALVHDDDRQAVADALADALHEGTDFAMEFRVLWPDGSVRWLAGRARMMRDAANNPVRLLGVTADIGERKSLEAQFRQAQKMEAVGQLAGGVAHDFNNLLTVIMSYADLVLHDLHPGDTSHADLLQVVAAAESAAALTKQLLAFSRKQVLEPTIVDVNALVQLMNKMLGRLLGGRIKLVTVLDPNLRAVRADRGQLEQVLMNLAVNARDAMPKGGRLIIETAEVELDGSDVTEVVNPVGSYVTLTVRDTGVGMDSATLERLFEPFFTTKEPGKGTGLGLATVYGIVQQSGGFVRVKSELGIGTTFTVYLPRVYDADEPVASAASTIAWPAATT